LSQSEATGAVPSRRRPGLSACAVRADRHSTQNDFGVQRFAPLTLDQLLSLQLVAPKDSNVPEQQRGRPVCLLIVTGRQATCGKPLVASHVWLATSGSLRTLRSQRLCVALCLQHCDCGVALWVVWATWQTSCTRYKSVAYVALPPCLMGGRVPNVVLVGFCIVGCSPRGRQAMRGKPRVACCARYDERKGIVHFSSAPFLRSLVQSDRQIQHLDRAGLVIVH